MIPFSGIPFLRFAIAFISGILFYIFIQPANDFFIITLCALAIYCLLFFIQIKRRLIAYSLRPALGFIAVCIMFFFGILFTQRMDEINDNNHILNCKNKISWYEATVVSIPEEKDKSYKVEVDINHVSFADNITAPLNGRIILYISKDHYTSLRYGDNILISGTPQVVKPPLNPGEFDYQQYLRFHHIYHTQFVKAGNYQIIKSGEGNLIVALAFYLRNKADGIIKKYITGKTEQGVASALILGIRGTMDERMKAVYSTTGTTHVIAVSGTHLTIVFLYLLKLFYLVRSTVIKNFILPIILLSSVWLYVLITGFSPSILRAGVMFSVLIISKAIRKETNIYNSIFFSALILLCYDPYMIMDVGFQLSYMAILSIVYFNDKIYTLKEFENWFADWTWKSVSVSLAAQIATLPICIFYFHQIPLTFLISNLFAVFVSELILKAGIILLAISFIPYLSNAVGWITENLIWIMNNVLYFISKIPYSSLQEMNLSIFQLILLYLIIIFVSLFIKFKRFNYFLISALCICFLGFTFLLKNISLEDQKKMIVFNIAEHEAITFINGKEAILIIDSTLMNDQEKFSRHIQPYLSKNGINSIKINSKVDWLQHYKTNNFDIFSINKKSFLLLKIQTPQKLPATDYLISSPKNYSLEDHSSSTQVILTSSKKKRKIVSQDIYDMSENPAFEISL